MPRRSPAATAPARRAAALALVTLGALALAAPAQSQPAAASVAGIYTCTDAQGRRITSDRPILDCNNREQRVLNRDGSVQRVLPPTLTAEERAEREATQRKADLARAAQADAARRDRNLVNRFPSQDSHDKARQAALDTVRLATRASEQRLRELAAERKPLLQEAEFYKNRTLPARLKQQLDANDAAVAAQRQSAANQALELARINRLYDAELERLRRLWSGAPAGSLPAMGVAARTLSLAASSTMR